MHVRVLPDLSIRAKLTLGFAGAFGLVLCIGVLALSQIDTVNDVTKEMRNVWLPKIRAVDRLRATAGEHRVLATRRLHSTNFRHLARISREMAAVRVDIDREMGGFRATFAGTERDLLEVFHGAWEFYRETLKQVEDRLEAGELIRAHALFEQRVMPAFEQAAYRLELLRGSLEERARQAELSAQGAHDLAVSLLAVLTLLAALAALAATWWVSRSISQPLTRISDAMRRLVAGDHQVEVQDLSRRSDEIGVLIQAVEGYRDALVRSHGLAVAAKRSAEEATAARARLEEAFEVVPEGLVLFDAEDRFVLWNETYAKLYDKHKLRVGARFEDVLREGVAMGLYPDAVGREEQWIAERLSHHGGDYSRHEQRLAGGRWVRIHERRTSEGGSVGVRIDITELKRREQELEAQYTKLDVALSGMPHGLAMFDAQERLVLANDRLGEIYGHPPEQLRPGTPLAELVAHRIDSGLYVGATVEQVLRKMRERLARGAPSHMTRKLGNGRTVTVSIRPRPDGGWVTAHEDVTEREVLKEQLNAALDNMAQALAMFDAEQRLIISNARFAEIFGLPPGTVRPGMTAREILEARVANGTYCGPSPDEYITQRLSVIRRGRPATDIGELADGRIIVTNHQPTADGGWVVTISDISEQRRLEARLAHLALHDALTDLPNRVFLQDRLEAALATARADEHVAVLCLDLDRFKEVNDSYGHTAGDALMRAVAARLRERVAKTAIVSRTGGDEFAIVHVLGEGIAEASGLAADLIDALSAPFHIDGHTVTTGTSIGIAVSPTDGSDAASLLKRADVALYRAKVDGRGTYRFFEPGMNALMQERRRLERDLRGAIALGQLELHYQPLVRLSDNEVSGFEALVRWNHPERGRVSPAEFIPLAEETGLIVSLGEWVLRQACADAARWPRPLKVAVNLSPVQFRSQSLVQTVLGALTSTGPPAARLELEITESALLQDSEATLEVLRRLHELGARIALDDFGTGYSSLSYLRSFPFDKIKIDRTFVDDLSSRRAESLAIFGAITSLAGKLGMVTTAEGVETREQAEIARAQGCTELQGYYFCPPRTNADITRLFLAEPASAGAAA